MAPNPYLAHMDKRDITTPSGRTLAHVTPAYLTRQVHEAVDAAIGEIVASDVAGRRTRDCTWVPTLLRQLENRLISDLADGAFGSEGVYEAAPAQGEEQAVSPPFPGGRDAPLSPRPSATWKEGNRNIRSIHMVGRHDGLKGSGNNKSGMVENTFNRYEAIVGRRMTTRTMGGQQAGVRFVCRVVYGMARLRTPDSHRLGVSLRDKGTWTRRRAMQQRRTMRDAYFRRNGG
jgi:hypothetical protein